MQSSPRIDELRQKFHENPRRYFAPLANEYRKAGDPEQAIAICRAHLAQQPAHMSGHVVYGQALYDARRSDEAWTVFEKALVLDPENVIVLRHLGDIARERGDTAEARHWYRRALEADPYEPEIAAYLAELAEPVTDGGVESIAGDSGAEASEAEPVAAREAEPLAAGEQATLEEAPPQEVTDEEATREEATPEEATLEEATLEEATPEEATPEEAVGEEAIGEEAVGEEKAGVAVVGSDTEPVESAAGPEGTEDDTAPHRKVPATAEEVDIRWRKTSPYEESPFVTRTMAELYARQGYHAAALDVFRQLALRHPGDLSIRSRIEELSGAAPGTGSAASPSVTEGTVDSPPEADADLVATPVSGGDDPVSGGGQLTADADRAPADEATLQTADELAATPETPAPPLAEPDDLLGWDTEVEPEFAPGNLSFQPGPVLSESGDKHFTELELSGDSWDTDAWGAGFDGGEIVSDDFRGSVELDSLHDERERSDDDEDAPHAAPESSAREAVDADHEEERSVEHEEALPAAQETSFSPALGTGEEHESSVDAEEEGPEAEGLRATQIPEPAAAEMGLDDAGAPESPDVTETTPQPAAPAPQPAAPAPQQSIRDFFAVIASRRPPASGASATARSASPAPSTSEPAPDAFSTLFAGSRVSVEDARAAAALSGASSAMPPRSMPPAPAESDADPRGGGSASRKEAPAPAANESEEDLRRFREWLDGLGSS